MINAAIRMRMAMGVALALGLGGASRAAAPLPLPEGFRAPDLRPTGFGAAVSALRRGLAVHLTPAEVDRLLARRDLHAALATLFQGWDDAADRLTVRATPSGLQLEVELGYRRCVASLEVAAGPEAVTPPLVCQDVAQPDTARSLEVSPDRWAPPKPKAPAAAKPAGNQVAGGAATPTPPEPSDREPPAGPPASVVRRTDLPGTDPNSPAAIVDGALAGHDDFRARLRRPHWKDPMLPADLLETGTALQPLAPNPVIASEAVDYHLQNPFDEARMRTAVPVPDSLSLGVVVAEPVIPGDRPECLAAWAERATALDPPTLDCFRRTSWNKELAGNTGYQIADFLARYLALPLIGDIRDLIAKDTTLHTAHRLVWAMVFLDWLQLHPDRTRDVLAKLGDEERRFFRRRLADLWVQRELGPYRTTITHLFEAHFVLLYPEARDLDGLPRRAFFPDQWLWATNWLSGATERDDSLITRAYGKLASPERRIIDALVHDTRFAGRYPRVASVLHVDRDQRGAE